MVEAELAIRREALSLPDFGWGEKMLKVQKWAEGQKAKGKSLFKVIEQSIKEPPSGLKAIFRRERGLKINVEALEATLEKGGIEPEEARDQAVIYALATDAETEEPLSLNRVIRVCQREMARIKKAKVLPNKVVGQVEDLLVKAQTSATRQRIAEKIRAAQEKSIIGGGRFPGKRPEKEEEKRKKAIKGIRRSWIKWGVVATLIIAATGTFGVDRYLEKAGRVTVGAQQKGWESLAAVKDPDYAAVVKAQEGLSSIKKDILRLQFDGGEYYMSGVLKELAPESLAGILREYGTTGRELTPKQIAIAGGWTKALREEGIIEGEKVSFIEGDRVNGKALKKYLQEKGYPDNLIDKFLGEYQKYVEIRGMGWLSPEESLKRLKEKEQEVGTAMRRFSTKDLRRKGPRRA